MGRGPDTEEVISIDEEDFAWRLSKKSAVEKAISRQNSKPEKLRRIKQRRRQRRKARRKGRSYETDPAALSDKIWYHGSPDNSLELEEILLSNNTDLTLIPGFYLASLGPAVEEYKRDRTNYQEPEGERLVFREGVAMIEKIDPPPRGSLYKVRVLVSSPLDGEAPVEQRLLDLIEDIFSRVKPGLLDSAGTRQMLAGIEKNHAALAFLVRKLKEISEDENDKQAAARAQQERLALAQTLIDAGWDCVIRRMISSAASGNNRAVNNATELALLNPARQIKQLEN